MTAPSRSHLGLFLSVSVGLLLAAWGGSALLASWRYHSGLEGAREAVAAGRFDEARPWLAGQASGGAADPEVLYLLGVCEHAAGRPDQAVEAWGRVPLAST